MAFRALCLPNTIRNVVQINDLIFARCMSSGGSAANIGFIGLGNMGGHMATNLMKKGHKLYVYDVAAPACDAMKSKGANVCKNQQEVAKQSDFVITMLPNNEIVANTYETMVKDGVNSNTIFIDSSTVAPSIATSVQKLVKSKGAKFVDAPVSGGVPGAEAGTLTFMVGGTVDEYNSVKNILEGMGKKITHCGDYGMGQAAKICNNMMLAISMIGVSEAMNLAIRLGLDPKTFADILNASTGRCWVTEVYNPVPGIIPASPPSKNYDGGFSIELLTKDLGLAQSAAITSNTPIPLGSISHQLYRSLKSAGFGKKDFAFSYQWLKTDKES